MTTFHHCSEKKKILIRSVITLCDNCSASQLLHPVTSPLSNLSKSRGKSLKFKAEYSIIHLVSLPWLILVTASKLPNTAPLQGMLGKCAAYWKIQTQGCTKSTMAMTALNSAACMSFSLEWTEENAPLFFKNVPLQTDWYSDRHYLTECSLHWIFLFTRNDLRADDQVSLK